MFNQLLTPIGGSLVLSFLVAALPIVAVLVLLGILRRPAWQASLVGLILAFIIAVGPWQVPPGIALSAAANGMVFAMWPVMWLLVNAMLLYNVTLRSGSFDAFQHWVIDHLPCDRRIVLIVIGFCFGALLEGISGYGAPVAITGSLLIALGFPAIQAVTFALIFNTTPVAFGGAGTPIVVLAGVTGLPDTDLAAMVGRQLPAFAFALPFYVVGIYAGWRSMLKVWPVLLVSGGSFALTQFVVANFIDYRLTDVLAGLVSLAVTVSFMKIWRPAADPAFAVTPLAAAAAGVGVRTARDTAVKAWAPWFIVSAVVIAWSALKIQPLGSVKIPWPGLHNQVFITLNNSPYGAVWDFQPMGVGTAILLAAVITAVALRVSVRDFGGAVMDTWRQVRLAIVTVGLIISLAYVMNYSGLNYTLGLGVASTGYLFPLISALLGWIAVLLSGSDASGNALFGKLQVVAANQLDLSPVLMAATNSSGGVMSKMISPQSLAAGLATTELRGREGLVFARTFKHSVIMVILLGVMAYVQQHYLFAMIPGKAMVQSSAAAQPPIPK